MQLNNAILTPGISFSFPETDPYWTNTSLLLHFNGTGSNIVDSSSYNRTLTTSYGTFQQTTADFKWGPASLAPSSSSVMQVDLTQIGTSQAWTWEGWFKRTANGNYCAFLNTDSGYTMLGLKTPANLGNYEFFLIRSGEYSLTCTTSIPIGTWKFLAMSCQDNGVGVTPTLRMFVDGVKEAELNAYLSFNSTKTFWIGRNDQAGFAGILGYLDDVRFTAGVCRYTTNFTPPTSQFPDS